VRFQNYIKIGTVESLREPESYKVTPDDRQEQIKVLGGVHIQDNGVFGSGMIAKGSALFSIDDWPTLEGYWLNRITVDVVDKYGKVLENRRLKITGFEGHECWDYYKVEFELWNMGSD
jgi:hypothetical protein